MSQRNSHSLDDEAIREVVQAFGLTTPQRICPQGGTATPKWSIDTAEGRFLLRIRPEEFADEEDIT